MHCFVLSLLLKQLNISAWSCLWKGKLHNTQDTWKQTVIITLSIKHGWRTADHGLRTGYKTRTRYKMRTTDHVGKNCASWIVSLSYK